MFGQLTIYSDQGGIQGVFKVSQQFTYVGKDKDCDIRYENVKFSPKQFLLTAVEGDAVKIHNLSKSSPTLINGKSIGFQIDHDLIEQDVITAGGKKMVWSYNTTDINAPEPRSLSGLKRQRICESPMKRQIAVVTPHRCDGDAADEQTLPPKKRKYSQPISSFTPHCSTEPFTPDISCYARRINYDRLIKTAPRLTTATRGRQSTSRLTPRAPLTSNLKTPGGNSRKPQKKISFAPTLEAPSFKYNHETAFNKSFTPGKDFSRCLPSSPFAFQGFNSVSEDQRSNLMQAGGSCEVANASSNSQGRKSGRVSTPFPNKKMNNSHSNRASRSRASGLYAPSIPENLMASPAGRRSTSQLGNDSAYRDSQLVLPQVNDSRGHGALSSYFSPTQSGTPRMMRADSNYMHTNDRADSSGHVYSCREFFRSNRSSSYGTPQSLTFPHDRDDSLYVNAPGSSQMLDESRLTDQSNFDWSNRTMHCSRSEVFNTPNQMHTPRRSHGVVESPGSNRFSPMSNDSSYVLLGSPGRLGGRNMSNMSFTHSSLYSPSLSTYNFTPSPTSTRGPRFGATPRKSLSVQVLSKSLQKKSRFSVNSPLNERAASLSPNPRSRWRRKSATAKRKSAVINQSTSKIESPNIAAHSETMNTSKGEQRQTRTSTADKSLERGSGSARKSLNKTTTPMSRRSLSEPSDTQKARVTRNSSVSNSSPKASKRSLSSANISTVVQSAEVVEESLQNVSISTPKTTRKSARGSLVVTPKALNISVDKTTSATKGSNKKSRKDSKGFTPKELKKSIQMRNSKKISMSPNQSRNSNIAETESAENKSPSRESSILKTPASARKSITERGNGSSKRSKLGRHSNSLKKLRTSASGPNDINTSSRKASLVNEHSDLETAEDGILPLALKRLISPPSSKFGTPLFDRRSRKDSATDSRKSTPGKTPQSPHSRRLLGSSPDKPNTPVSNRRSRQGTRNSSVGKSPMLATPNISRKGTTSKPCSPATNKKSIKTASARNTPNSRENYSLSPVKSKEVQESPKHASAKHSPVPAALRRLESPVSSKIGSPVSSVEQNRQTRTSTAEKSPERGTGSARKSLNKVTTPMSRRSLSESSGTRKTRLTRNSSVSNSSPKASKRSLSSANISTVVQSAEVVEESLQNVSLSTPKTTRKSARGSLVVTPKALNISVDKTTSAAEGSNKKSRKDSKGFTPKETKKSIQIRNSKKISISPNQSRNIYIAETETLKDMSPSHESSISKTPASARKSITDHSNSINKSSRRTSSINELNHLETSTTTVEDGILPLALKRLVSPPCSKFGTPLFDRRSRKDSATDSPKSTRGKTPESPHSQRLHASSPDKPNTPVSNRRSRPGRPVEKSLMLATPNKSRNDTTSKPCSPSTNKRSIKDNVIESPNAMETASPRSTPKSREPHSLSPVKSKEIQESPKPSSVPAALRRLESPVSSRTSSPVSNRKSRSSKPSSPNRVSALFNVAGVTSIVSPTTRLSKRDSTSKKNILLSAERRSSDLHKTPERVTSRDSLRSRSVDSKTVSKNNMNVEKTRSKSLNIDFVDARNNSISNQYVVPKIVITESTPIRTESPKSVSSKKKSRSPKSTGANTSKGTSLSTPPKTVSPLVVLRSSRNTSRSSREPDQMTPTSAFRRNPKRTSKPPSPSARALKRKLDSLHSPQIETVVKKLKLDPVKPDKKKLAALMVCHKKKSSPTKDLNPFKLREIEKARRSLPLREPKSEANSKVDHQLSTSIPTGFNFQTTSTSCIKQEGSNNSMLETVVSGTPSLRFENETQQASPEDDLLNALDLSRTSSLLPKPDKPPRRLRSTTSKRSAARGFVTSTPHASIGTHCKDADKGVKKLLFRSPLVDYEGSKTREEPKVPTNIKSILIPSPTTSSDEPMSRVFTTSPVVDYTDSNGKKKLFRAVDAARGGIRELIAAEDIDLSGVRNLFEELPSSSSGDQHSVEQPIPKKRGRKKKNQVESPSKNATVSPIKTSSTEQDATSDEVHTNLAVGKRTRSVAKNVEKKTVKQAKIEKKPRAEESPLLEVPKISKKRVARKVQESPVPAANNVSTGRSRRTGKVEQPIEPSQNKKTARPSMSVSAVKKTLRNKAIGGKSAGEVRSLRSGTSSKEQKSPQKSIPSTASSKKATKSVVRKLKESPPTPTNVSSGRSRRAGKIEQLPSEPSPKKKSSPKKPTKTSSKTRNATSPSMTVPSGKKTLRNKTIAGKSVEKAPASPKKRSVAKKTSNGSNKTKTAKPKKPTGKPKKSNSPVVTLKKRKKSAESPLPAKRGGAAGPSKTRATSKTNAKKR